MNKRKEEVLALYCNRLLVSEQAYSSEQLPPSPHLSTCQQAQGISVLHKDRSLVGIQQCSHQGRRWMESCLCLPLQFLWADSNVLWSLQLPCHIPDNDEQAICRYGGYGCYGMRIGPHLFHYTFVPIDFWFSIHVHHFSYVLLWCLSVHCMVTFLFFTLYSLPFPFTMNALLLRKHSSLTLYPLVIILPWPSTTFCGLCML